MTWETSKAGAKHDLFQYAGLWIGCFRSLSGAMTLSITTLTLSIMTLSKTTLTLSTMTFSITTLGIKGLYLTLSTQHK